MENIKTFKELISEYSIEIPIIQRDYVQGRTGKEKLREQFLTSIKEKLENNEPLELDFIYGSVVNKDNKNVFQPLDGQQRLTTLFLLHWYIANKENEENEDFDLLADKFTYETRVSSRDFCKQLSKAKIEIDNINDDGKVSEKIIDQNWFVLSWKKDPTVKAILTMLDDIHKHFKDTKDLWEKLDKITFKFIKMKDFGLSDDLYVKMNARGKALTPFENFKAELVGHIKENEWEKDEPLENTIAHKLDTKWTDLFWKYRDEQNKIDDAYLKVISAFCMILSKNEDTIKELNNDFKELEVSDFKGKEDFEYLEKALDKYSGIDQLQYEIPFWGYLSEGNNNFFEEIIKGKLEYKKVVLFYAETQYLLNKGIDENINRWMRVVRNIVENSTIDTPETFINTISLIRVLSEGINDIYKHLATPKIKSDREQVKEEIEKAKIIRDKDNNWEAKIIEAENYAFFKGAIRFLFRDDENNADWNKFESRFERAKEYFDEKGVKHKKLPFKERTPEINKNNTLFIRKFINTYNSFEKGIYWIKLGYKADIWKNHLLNNKRIKNINSLLDNDDLKEPKINSDKFKEEQLAYKDLFNPDFLAECLYFFSNGFWCRPWGGKIMITEYNARADWKRYIIGDKRNEILSELDITTERRIYELPYYWGVDISFKYKDKEFIWTLDDKIYLLGEKEEIFGVKEIKNSEELIKQLDEFLSK